MTKQETRRHFLNSRKELSFLRREEASFRALDILYPLLQTFDKVFSFASHEDEIDLWPLNCLLAQELRLLLPKIVGNNIVACAVNLDDELVVNEKFQLLEPKNIVEVKNFKCVLVPAIAFDENNNRLGYGQGYYDRFLRTINQKIPFWGVGFVEQLSREPLPINADDVPLTKVFLF